MLVVHFDNGISVDGVPMAPGVRYVVSEDVAQTMVTEGKRGGVMLMKHSGFNSYERRLRPEAVKEGDIVCIWRHNAYGDNLMITGLCAYLKQALRLRVHVVCAPHVFPIWMAMDKNIRPDAVLPTPVHFDACLNLYSAPRGWTVFYQAMLEENREVEQDCAIDDLWRFAGFDEGVGEDFRKPLIRQHPHKGGKDIGISLHSGNSTRTLPLAWNVELIEGIFKKFPERKIRVFGSDKNLGAKLDKFKLPIENHVGNVSFDATMQMVESQVEVMISPDSALLHLAEGLGKRSIGLWGLFDPDDRAKYYKHHTGITGFDGCPHAPCRWHGMNEFPMWDCGKLEVPNHCNALSSIKTEDVVEAI